jgi:hypothetical protein
VANIDDEIEQGRAQYPVDGQSIPSTLAQEAFKKGLQHWLGLLTMAISSPEGNPESI